MQVTSGWEYEYQEDGVEAIVVVSIQKQYETYNTDYESGEFGEVIVKIADDWDGYGPLPASVREVTVSQFLENVGETIGRLDFDDGNRAVNES